MMKNIKQNKLDLKTGLTMSQVGQIGTFLSRLEFVFFTGFPFRKFWGNVTEDEKQKGFTVIGEGKLWKLLEIDWPFPSLKQWAKLGMPCNTDEDGNLYFKRDEIEAWAYKVRVVLSNIEYRIEHSMEYENYDDLYHYDTFREEFVCVQSHPRFVIIDEGHHLRIRAKLKDSQFFSSFFFNAHCSDKKPYWEHIRMYDVNGLATLLHDVAGISKAKLLSTAGIIPIQERYDSFSTESPYVHSDFLSVANTVLKPFQANSHLFKNDVRFQDKQYIANTKEMLDAMRKRIKKERKK